jgi:hypothetical protein
MTALSLGFHHPYSQHPSSPRTWQLTAEAPALNNSLWQQLSSSTQWQPKSTTPFLSILAETHHPHHQSHRQPLVSTLFPHHPTPPPPPRLPNKTGPAPPNRTNPALDTSLISSTRHPPTEPTKLLTAPLCTSIQQLQPDSSHLNRLIFKTQIIFEQFLAINEFLRQHMFELKCFYVKIY